ncbi:MAG: Luciferase [Acidimicrobiia bacterium]|nr:Luciferase [Acidimicrobiia bacterium]
MFTQRFRFGVQAAHASSKAEWQELARRTEALGYSVLTVPDHFGRQLAPMPAMMAAADATTTLRVGALVFDNDYKHPLVLAKELATMDVLCDGRLEIGLGAGWDRSDYQQSGIPYDTPKVRVDRFEEGLAVIEGHFGPGPFSFAGQHYQIIDHDGWPKPVQTPRPPILIGGGGPRVLRIAVDHADIVGINGDLSSGEFRTHALGTMTAAGMDAKVALVRELAGARLPELELNIRVFFGRVTADRDAALEKLARALGPVPPDDLAHSPFALIGPRELLVEQLLERRERWGLSYFVIGAEMVDAFAPVVAQLAGR